MKKPKLILIGGGGHCASCIEVIESEGSYEIEGIIDLPSRVGEKVLEYKIIGTDGDIEKFSKLTKFFFITIGHINDSKRRETLFNELISRNLILPTIVSPNSIVSKRAKIGMGTIVMHHAMINVNANIGNNCIINSKSLVEHDVTIGDNCHISTGAIINGGVKVGSNSFFGSNAVCREMITIPENSFIKANSLVK